ncbi:hypothetical protein QTP88_028283 [Uroleucon formosanum]
MLGYIHLYKYLSLVRSLLARVRVGAPASPVYLTPRRVHGKHVNWYTNMQTFRRHQAEIRPVGQWTGGGGGEPARSSLPRWESRRAKNTRETPHPIPRPRRAAAGRGSGKPRRKTRGNGRGREKNDCVHANKRR